ncbi:MAG: 30S ribosomal protein S2 [Armatimonadetes bacterium]|nr:30S ribosomal protein S2 [Armatimonadota bacterium]
MSATTMKELLEAGVHFGHQTKRWNPKMKRYIYGGRNGIYIIDLHQTLRLFDEAVQFIQGIVENGGHLLFVGTKKQAQDAIKEAAQQCGQYYVNQRWLGGMLTNWPTIRLRINHLRELKRMEEDGTIAKLTKKEGLKLAEERDRLECFFGGIKDMPGLPDVVFVVDLKKEALAIHEARLLNIPIVAVVDTNCDPDLVDYVVPGNDDAIRAIKLFCTKIAESIVELKQGDLKESDMVEETDESEKPEEDEPSLDVIIQARDKADSSDVVAAEEQVLAETGVPA